LSISYTLASNPLWYFVDVYGVPLGGGYVVFLDSLNPTQQKLVFQDGAGNFPWPTSTVPNVGSQGVLIDANGTAGPFFFEFDTSNPDSLYDIYWYDLNGVQQGDPILDFTPPGGSGGSTTEIFEVKNLIDNGVFYRNAGTVSPVPAFQKLAPSNHAGLAATTSNAGPDIIFFKGNTSATDTISFPALTPGQLSPDITPTNCFNYACTGAGSSESMKIVQFPINAKIQNLSNQTVSCSIWAQSSSGSQITVQGMQFYGDGAGAHANVISNPTALTLTNSWAQYTFSITFGNISGNTIGSCGNDGTFLQVELPINTTCNISLVKPEMFLGSNPIPLQDFQTYDDIESKVNSPRTGDIRTSMNSHYFWGWVPMNDGTIGDAASNATTRANVDTFPLFNEIWTKMQSNQQYAPMYNSSGASTAYGASAIADFTANNQLALTKGLGQVFGGTSPLVAPAQTYTVVYTTSTSIMTATNSMFFPTGTPVILANSGGGAPTGLTVGQVYYSIYQSATTIQLATTLANALAGTPVTFSSNGTGTNTVQVFADVMGSYYGERQAVGAHFHTSIHAALFSPNDQVVSSSSGGAISGNVVSPTSQTTGGTNAWTTGTNANSQEYNLQPTTWLNVYLKL
jgi:hypothetical protein